MPVEHKLLPVMTCARCGHVWQPVDEKTLPTICPKCKSVRWNVVEAPA
ncbi:MAG: hypothetical protein WCB19_05615 [Thermoplasmata archaeon]